MPRNPEVTQQRLIDTAAEIMATVGIAGLRVDQLVAHEVNKRMIITTLPTRGLARRVLAEQVHVCVSVCQT